MHQICYMHNLLNFVTIKPLEDNCHRYVDVYLHSVKLTFGRIANFSSCLSIGPFYANLHHQLFYHDQVLIERHQC